MTQSERRQEPNGVGGPWVTMAVFCEKVLREKDEVLSLVRVVDRFEVIVPNGTMGMVVTTMVVGLKPGDFRGGGTFRIVHTDDAGQVYPGPSDEVTFPNALEGTQIEVNFRIGVVVSGVHRFDVEFNERTIGRAWLLIEVVRPSQEPETGSGFAPEGGPTTAPRTPSETAGR